MIEDKNLLKNDKNILIKYLKKGDYANAFEIALKISKTFPHDVFCWKVISNIHFRNKRFKESLSAINTAISINSEDTNAISIKGIILSKLNLNEDAIKSFRKVLDIDQNSFDAYLNLGVIYNKISKFNESIHLYEKAIEINPNSALIYNNLANVQKNLNLLDKASANYKNALKLDPSYINAKNNLEILNRELKLLNFFKNKKIKSNFNKDFLQKTYITERDVEINLLSNLYKVNSTKLNEIIDGPLFGNGSTTDYQLFENNFIHLDFLKTDLLKIIKNYFQKEVFLMESFLNILKEDSGSVFHDHINNFDTNNNLSTNKFSLVYYISVGDQKSSKPGIFKMKEPEEEILPKNGMIIIIPASRKHSAIYNGKIDRVMVGINFYVLN